jgi:hypothetical protein
LPAWQSGGGLPLVDQELLNAFTEFDRSLGRSWGGVMADQSLLSQGVQYQDHLERRGCGGSLHLGSASCGTVDPDQHLSYTRVIDISHSKENNMLWTICVILLVLWLLGMLTAYTMGGLIHLLLVVALIVMVFRILQGRRVV